MAMICKKCRKAFRLDVTEFDEAKQYCPHCDNHFYKEAITPQAAIVTEAKDVREDNRLAQLRDLRMKMMLVSPGLLSFLLVLTIQSDDKDLFDEDIHARLG
jgi:hypothetical protein